MSKFKVGEIAIYTAQAPHQDFMKAYIGQECEVVRVGGWIDYEVKFQNGDINGVRKISLRKRRPPEQPSAFSYDEIISMCNGTDIRPTETQAPEKYICK